jgi:dynein intermediate chain
MDRKEELEKKRKKLQEIRKAKEERKNSSKLPQDLDDLVSSLIDTKSRPSIKSVLSNDSEITQTLSAANSLVSIPLTSPTNNSDFTTSDQIPKRVPPTLSVFDSLVFDLPPKEKIIYEKEVQTSSASSEWIDYEKNKAIQTSVVENTAKAVEEEQKVFLSDAEKSKILSSDGFIDFFLQKSKIIEKALDNREYDFLTDYTKLDEGDGSGKVKSLQLFNTFYDRKWSQGRIVTDINWSYKFPELFLASYGQQNNNVVNNGVDGMVLIWNLHLKERPEFIFQSHSDVTSALFSPFHPNLIIGGCYSGQILMWDTRVKLHPVLKSSFSNGHYQPIYNMKIVGTQNSHDLVSISTDGMVCYWSLDMLSKPQESLLLSSSKNIKSEELAVTTSDFPSNETSTFWVGTEAGEIHQVNRYEHAGSKAGVLEHEVYAGHDGPITRLCFHPSCGSSDFSDLFLTSSIDWSVKLWKARVIIIF